MKVGDTRRKRIMSVKLISDTCASIFQYYSINMYDEEPHPSYWCHKVEIHIFLNEKL